MTTIYYIPPECLGDIESQKPNVILFSQNKEMYERRFAEWSKEVREHEKTHRYTPHQFETAFNEGVITTEGYIIVKVTR